MYMCINVLYMYVHMHVWYVSVYSIWIFLLVTSFTEKNWYASSLSAMDMPHTTGFVNYLESIQKKEARMSG